MRKILLPLLAFSLVACAVSRFGEAVFPANYHPSDDPLPPPIPSCASPVQVTVTDIRNNPSVVGRRYEERSPTVEYPLRIQGDVPAYVRAGLDRALKGLSTSTGRPGVATLALTVTEITVEEKIVHNADFKGQIALEAGLTSPSGQPCWKGRVHGSSTNYGRAGNTENYVEVLNLALDRAVASLLNAPGFIDALCGRCSAS